MGMDSSEMKFIAELIADVLVKGREPISVRA